MARQLRPDSRACWRNWSLLTLLAALVLLGGCSVSSLSDPFAANNPVTVLPNPRPIPTPTVPRQNPPATLNGGITFQPQFLSPSPTANVQTIQQLPPQTVPPVASGTIVTSSAVPYSPSSNGSYPSISLGPIDAAPVYPGGAGYAGGAGPVGSPQGDKVAMLLPLSGAGSLATAAREIRTAALVAKAADSGLQLSFHDTGGSAAGAQQAAQQALAEGAGLILGPLLGSSIDAVAQVTLPRGVSLLSLSNDSSRARPGAYVLGLGPEGAIDRVLAYAASQGKRDLALVTTQDAYGDAARQAAERAAARHGLTIRRRESYAATSGSDGKSDVAKALSDDPGFDSLLIADLPSRSRELAALLQFHQFNFARKQIMGTDRWQDAPELSSEVGLRNAWFAAPATSNASLLSSLRSRLGGEPSTAALVGHDAVLIASELRRGGGFSTASITRPSGFLGATGLIRLSPAGQVQRAYEVRQITSSGSRQIAPAQSGGGAGF